MCNVFCFIAATLYLWFLRIVTESFKHVGFLSTHVFVFIFQQDPELQDPLSLSLNENYDDQNLPHHDSKKAPASPDYNCETPEIQVIIKEEEEGWTVSENREWKILPINKLLSDTIHTITQT